MTESEIQKEDYNVDFGRIKELISNYDQIKKSGEIKRYNEETTKKDFILPLFEALGWNVYNRGKRNDSISAEETISKKRVDYGFRINGIPKFFLEAKSLKEGSIQNNPNYVKQAIDYAWMKSCSWAVLTNFDIIAVYNADWKETNYGNNLLFVLHTNEFLTDSRFVNLSKESFDKNELDIIASKYGKKQIKNPINKQLLLDMIHFREILSKDIVRNNRGKPLSKDDIDESVQRILDRLIFIRNAEDRGLEENRLQSNVRQWSAKGKGNLIKEISKIYSYFDDQYNSKLFANHLCDDLYIDNDILQEVIEGLNQSKDNSYKYDFSVIESDILGNIYEQYLGNILKSTPKRAKLESSKTHRKEQGIYYTPSYIVDYIVKNTIGEYIKTHTPEEIRNVKILDPACGSGSFLIRAYRELEDYWSKQEGLENTRLDIEGEHQFYSRKVEILKNNIFGVDLDQKAVEIAQLNLLLQISERKHRLPLLQNNIKVGNSLIDNPSVSDKAFKWQEEFPEIMNNGGFNIIIGNPPYFKIFIDDPLNQTDDYKEIKSGMMNVSALFINRSQKLLNTKGYLGMIVPKMLAYTESWGKLRNKLLNNLKIIRVVDCEKAFKDVLLEQIIFIVKNENDKLEDNKIIIGELNNVLIKETATIIQRLCIIGNRLLLEPNPIAYSIKNNMESSGITLGKIADITLGLGIQGKSFFVNDFKTGYEKVLRGDDIQRYFIRGSKFYDPLDTNIWPFKKTIESFKRPHIVAQRIVAHIRDHIKITAALDDEGLFSFNTVTNIFIKDHSYTNEFILGILNSNAVQYYVYKFIYSNAIRSMDFYKAYAEKIPIPEFNKLKFDEISKTINQNYKELNKMNIKKTDHSNKIEERIISLEYEINKKIYELYKLNPKQIDVIEKSLL